MKALLSLLMVIVVSNQAFGKAGGGQEGGGGDAYATDFVGHARVLLAGLHSRPIEGVDPVVLARALDEVLVSSEPRLFLDEREVDAINYPFSSPPRIKLSRKGWDALKETPHLKYRLAFHEYLGILGIDDTGYQISSRLNQTNVCERSTVVKRDLEDAIGIKCHRMEAEDLFEIRTLFLGDPRAARLSDFSNPGPSEYDPEFPSDRFDDDASLGEESTAITSLTPGDLGQLSRLEFLNIGGYLESLSPGSFGELRELRTLVLGLSSSQLARNAFIGLDSLRTLLIVDEIPKTWESTIGQLQRIESGAFGGLNSLKTLRLVGVGLTDILPGTFAGLNSLTSLEVNGSALQTIRSGAFSDVPNLEILDFTYRARGPLYRPSLGDDHEDRMNSVDSSISHIDSGAFANLSRLRTLILCKPWPRFGYLNDYDNAAYLRAPSSEMFSGLGKVQHLRACLDLSEIREESKNVFTEIKDVRNIELRLKSAKRLRKGSFAHLKELKRVEAYIAEKEGIDLGQQLGLGAEFHCSKTRDYQMCSRP